MVAVASRRSSCGKKRKRHYWVSQIQGAMIWCWIHIIVLYFYKLSWFRLLRAFPMILHISTICQSQVKKFVSQKYITFLSHILKRQFRSQFYLAGYNQGRTQMGTRRGNSPPDFSKITKFILNFFFFCILVPPEIY